MLPSSTTVPRGEKQLGQASAQESSPFSALPEFLPEPFGALPLPEPFGALPVLESFRALPYLPLLKP